MKLNDPNSYYPSTLITVPKLNEEFIDPSFNTKIKRISSTSTTPDDSFGDGRKVVFINPEYSTSHSFNIDNTYLLLLHFGYFAIYTGEGRFIRNCLFKINASSQPRWTNDPDTFIFIMDNALWYHNVKTNFTAEYYRFPEYSKITASGEGDLSEDGHYLTLMGNSETLFLFDCLNLKKGKILTLPQKGIVDGFYTTPDNNVLVSFVPDRNNSGMDFSGIEYYDPDMNLIRRVTDANGHMDTLRVNGRESLAWASAAERKDNSNSIKLIDLATNERITLLTTDWSLAFHVSCADRDKIFVETYGSPVPSRALWKRYCFEILCLEGNDITRIVHHRSVPLKDNDSYTWQPKVSSNKAGDRLVFGSNWGLQPHINYSDTYLIKFSESVPVIPAPVVKKEISRYTYNGETFVLYRE